MCVPRTARQLGQYPQDPEAREYLGAKKKPAFVPPKAVWGPVYPKNTTGKISTLSQPEFGICTWECTGQYPQVIFSLVFYTIFTVAATLATAELRAALIGTQVKKSRGGLLEPAPMNQLISTFGRSRACRSRCKPVLLLDEINVLKRRVLVSFHNYK